MNKPEEKVGNALRLPNTDQHRIATAGLDLTATLLDKNHDYGSSAWDVPLLCPQLSVGDAILCRMSDKIKRIQSLQKGNQAQVAEVP